MTADGPAGPPCGRRRRSSSRILSVDRNHMADPDRISKLRHDLSNPLSALLAETQLLLLNEAQIDPATVVGLKEIEALAIRMRTMLREI